MKLMQSYRFRKLANATLQNYKQRENIIYKDRLYQQRKANIVNKLETHASFHQSISIVCEPFF